MKQGDTSKRMNPFILTGRKMRRESEGIALERGWERERFVGKKPDVLGIAPIMC